MIFDLKNNFRQNIKLLVGTTVLFMLACLYFAGACGRLGETGYWGDYMLYIFRGMYVIDSSQTGRNIDIPAMHIGLALIFTYIGFRYISSDISVVTAVRFSSRRRWLVGKILSNVCVIVSVYAAGILVSGIWSGFTVGFNEKIDRKLMKVDLIPADFNQVWVYLLGCLLATVSVCMFQMTFSFLFNYITGIVVTLFVYIFSIFDSSIIWLGNGIMMQRWEIFRAGGISIAAGYGLALAVGIISMAVMAVMVRRKDI